MGQWGQKEMGKQTNNKKHTPQSCGKMWNMKSSLINYSSLSCVSINIQSRNEKSFESYYSFKIHPPYALFPALNTCNSHHHQPVIKPNWE